MRATPGRLIWGNLVGLLLACRKIPNSLYHVVNVLFNPNRRKCAEIRRMLPVLLIVDSVGVGDGQ